MHEDGWVRVGLGEVRTRVGGVGGDGVRVGGVEMLVSIFHAYGEEI